MTYTRLDRDIFLIGLSEFEPLSNLNQLPTTRQVLQRFHHHLKDTKLVRDASHLTVEEVLVLWGRAAIPTVLKKHAIEKLEKIHDKWLKLKKNKTRLSETQQKNEACYTEQ
ncbi:hypothetical protein Bpfe_010796 [Biomphalaria pfeifferi]|uniref:Uncharacterized protein n=1 Tax=Biomphalaria pfeifferi TaxID=112525 RepID=A0AAD8BSA7_BIOPF|nr:hypothetical protein Bpfe_010796 [Biomphalaria pfeifferi]